MRLFRLFGKGTAKAVHRLAKLDDTPTSTVALHRRELLTRYAELREWRVSPAAAAKALGVSLRTLRTWQSRQRREGLRGLEPLSRRPHRRRTASKRNDLSLRGAVREWRQHYPFGKEKLGVLLRRQGWEVSDSTVGRLLALLRRRREVPPVRVGKRRRALGAGEKRPHALPYRQPADYHAAGDCVQLDTLTATLANGTPVKLFTATDGCCRYGWLMPATTATASAAVRFLNTLPSDIRSLQTDGGSEFKGVFEQTCHERGIRQVVLPPRSPHLNGRVEAFNGTMRRELLNVWERAENLGELKQQAATWLKFYNGQRPHGALAMQSPVQFLAKRPSLAKSAICGEL